MLLGHDVSLSVFAQALQHFWPAVSRTLNLDGDSDFDIKGSPKSQSHTCAADWTYHSYIAPATGQERISSC